MSRKIIIHLLALLFLAIVAVAFIHFLEFHEKRASHFGWIPSDPIGELLPSADVSYPIFSITYGSLILYAVLSFNTEFFVPRLMLAYAFILLFRFLTLTLVPFKAPTSYVFLEDPFLNELIYPGHIRNDLFFSGHTALVFAIFILSKKRWLFLFFALLTGILVMVQRVHYSYDVLAAFPFAWLAAKLADRIISCVYKGDNV
jgi:membrane-associated phospholipid phosphatase